jgi:hypothetical protein
MCGGAGARRLALSASKAKQIGCICAATPNSKARHHCGYQPHHRAASSNGPLVLDSRLGGSSKSLVRRAPAFCATLHSTCAVDSCETPTLVAQVLTGNSCRSTTTSSTQLRCSKARLLLVTCLFDDSTLLPLTCLARAFLERGLSQRTPAYQKSHPERPFQPLRTPSGTARLHQTASTTAQAHAQKAVELCLEIPTLKFQ